ncbi:bifunctional oligoribonuclease/PAP phosphatase NrnA [soil metagenome]
MEIKQISEMVAAAKRIAIIQADNPDADSLGSALALENIIGDMGKEPYMYCALDIPEYLRHMSGWDRVNKELPTQFDLSIIVDTSSITLLEKLDASPQRAWVVSQPCIVLDHHAGVACDIPYATIVLNDPSKVSTGELIYSIARTLKWPMSIPTQEYIMNSILADSMGLASENTTSETYRVMAELVDAGVSRPELEQLRRALTKMPEPIFRYKAELIKRTELQAEGKLALIIIPQDEISRYSPLYNPNALIQGEHLQTKGVLVSVAIKSYANGRITAGIRCNIQAPLAAKLANKFGGDGHAYAAGFKTEGKLLSEIKSGCIDFATELLQNLNAKEM